MTLLRHLPRFRQAYRQLTTLQEREGWSRSKIESFQLERLNRLWDEAIHHTAYYRKLVAQSGLPNEFRSLQAFRDAVPTLPKQQVRTRRSDFLSDRAEPGKWHLTGGSTGAPTHVFRSARAHGEMLRARYSFHAAWDVDIFDRWAYLWGHSASFAPGLRGFVDRVRRPAEDRLRNRLRLSAYRLGRDDLRRSLDRLVKFQPRVIYTYSTAGYLLAQEAEAAGIRLPSLRMVNLTAEPAFPHIVQTVERAFGVPAIQEYGSVECGFLAGEMPDRTLRIREDNILLETTPRDDGRHDLLVTVLGSLSFPLIRYRIGDVTDQPISPTDTGFATLHNVGGRDNDLIISRDGQPLHNFWFDDMLEHHPSVRRYRIHQDAEGAVAVTIEPTAPGAPLDLEKLEATMREHVGYPVGVQVVDVMQGNAAGKHRWISSDLAISLSPDQRHALNRPAAAPQPSIAAVPTA